MQNIFQSDTFSVSFCIVHNTKISIGISSIFEVVYVVRNTMQNAFYLYIKLAKHSTW